MENEKKNSLFKKELKSTTVLLIAIACVVLSIPFIIEISVINELREDQADYKELQQKYDKLYEDYCKTGTQLCNYVSGSYGDVFDELVELREENKRLNEINDEWCAYNNMLDEEVNAFPISRESSLDIGETSRSNFIWASSDFILHYQNENGEITRDVVTIHDGGGEWTFYDTYDLDRVEPEIIKGGVLTVNNEKLHIQAITVLDEGVAEEAVRAVFIRENLIESGETFEPITFYEEVERIKNRKKEVLE